MRSVASVEGVVAVRHPRRGTEGYREGKSRRQPLRHAESTAVPTFVNVEGFRRELVSSVVVFGHRVACRVLLDFDSCVTTKDPAATEVVAGFHLMSMGPARCEPQASEPAERAQLHARPRAPEHFERAPLSANERHLCAWRLWALVGARGHCTAFCTASHVYREAVSNFFREYEALCGSPRSS